MAEEADATQQQPIGVFDSGIGGLTVVRAIRDLLPREEILYLGDTARVPYGSKSATTVERYSLEIADMLLQRGAKGIVVACNSASSVALPKLEEVLTVPVVGVIRPGAEAAIAATRSGHVGVIGTRATVRSGAYERHLQDLSPDIEVTSLACPLLVPLIEEGLLNDPLTEHVLRRYLEPMLEKGVDTLVLGCTHYPLLISAIQKVVGPDVRVVDSARNCAVAVQKLLNEENLGADQSSIGGLHVSLTDTPDHFLGVAKQALELDIGEIEIREVLHRVTL